MATGAGKKNARAESERARLYQARRQFHAGTVRRRTRDNLIAGVGGGVLILAILGAQWAYFTAGPGRPEPTPASTSTPAPSPEPTPSASPEPDASQTPAPDPTATTSPSPDPAE
ncbi:dioxygenase [Microbacterium sp. MC2]